MTSASPWQIDKGILKRAAKSFSSSHSKGLGINPGYTSTRLPEAFGIYYAHGEGWIYTKPPEISKSSANLSNEINDLYDECSIKNWDGYGARPLYRSLRKVIEKFLKVLPQNIPAPEVTPEPDGEVSLEWYYAKDEIFSISIGRKNRLAYAAIDGERRSSGIEVFKDTIPKSLIFQLKTFLANKSK